MLDPKPTYRETYSAFRWDLPERYNIGLDVCDRWATQTPERVALIDVSDDGSVQRHTYGMLRARSNQLANLLHAHGCTGERVGVLLPQQVETALAHIAVAKMGSVSIPLFTLFGPDALLHRLEDSGAAAIITNAEGAALIASIRDQLPALKLVLSVDGASDGVLDFDEEVEKQNVAFTPVDTHLDDPAILIYTSGTTGNPKGALHAHRVLLGHLPGVEISHNFLPQPDDKIWTPADWAWIGGLLDVLLPALHHGVPIVAHRFRKFTAEAAFDFMKRHGIRNAFLPPTALKIMRQHPSGEDWGLSLRSVASGGEPLGAELLDWGKHVFGTTINEFYGQTECNMIVSSCIALDEPEPGIMGFPVPGHDLEIIDANTGVILADLEEGEIAVKAPNPVMFLEYFNNPDATAAKFVTGPHGRFLKTGDRGLRTSSGRIRFVGRDDDVISSAGYRIGPAEIEDCLLTHPAVQMAGVVGKDDPIRGQVVTAFVKLVDGGQPSEQLADAIATHVKSRLAAYEYPRIVRFIAEMPLTTTGKIIRARLREIANTEG